jgi:S-DNA-T family DNA segregation ATPase FtsK/SpoIIIE
VALLAGAFLALATFPPSAPVTGPLGKLLGGLLRGALGVGAAAVPLIPLFWAGALFGHLDRVIGRRVTILLAGLVFAVPFAVGVVYQYGSEAARAEIAIGRMYSPSAWVGLVPSFFVFYLKFLGPLGEGLLALGAFSALTISTVGWNPLGKLRSTKGEEGKGGKRGEEERGGRGERDLVGEGDEAPPLHGDTVDEAMGSGQIDDLIDLPRERKKREKKERIFGAGESPPPPAARAVEGAAVEVTGTAAGAGEYELPPIDILDLAAEEAGSFEAELDRIQRLLVDTLRQFKVETRAGSRTTGPVVTQFELIPEPGVKVGRIAALADDLALAIKAQSIRIVAPIPGRGAVGVEVPNPRRRSVGLRKLLESPAFRETRQELPIALGEDLEGRPIVTDLARMPHLLIAGATGSGKSVCMNTIITSLVYHLPKEHLRMLMIDPKMVELAMYRDLPHLRHAVVTDHKDAAKVFKWAVWEMQDRYGLLHANGARNVVDFNRKVASGSEMKDPKGEPYTGGRMPYIVLFVDELADLMMTAAAEVETPLAQLAQKARAIGIHVVLATQRPSVNVITGLIKANFSSRIAFRVASKVDSRTILDQNGAEALLGYGDMLFMPPGKNDADRIQGAFISTEETERLMAWYEERRLARIAAQAEAALEPDIIELAVERAAAESDAARATAQEYEDEEPEERDKLFRQAAEVCIQAQGGSTSLLQRRLKIGYGRAARLMDQLEDAGVLGPSDGPRGREVLIGLDQLDEVD